MTFMIWRSLSSAFVRIADELLFSPQQCALIGCKDPLPPPLLCLETICVASAHDSAFAPRVLYMHSASGRVLQDLHCLGCHGSEGRRGSCRVPRLLSDLGPAQPQRGPLAALQIEACKKCSWHHINGHLVLCLCQVGGASSIMVCSECLNGLFTGGVPPTAMH